MSTMDSINRFIWGPTPEQRVREWQAKLRAESRKLDREMHQVRSRSYQALAVRHRALAVCHRALAALHVLDPLATLFSPRIITPF